jgi:hypothetical protein
MNRRKTPEECLEELTLTLDMNLVSSKGGGDILSYLQHHNCNVKFEKLPLDHSVKWTRSSSSSSLNSQDSQSMSEDSDAQPQELQYILIRLQAETLGSMICSQTLYSFVKNIRNTHPNKSTIYVLEGLDEYLKDQKRLMRSASEVAISKSEIDKVLVWLQIEAKVHIRETASPIDSADYIYRLTCSIATAPYR